MLDIIVLVIIAACVAFPLVRYLILQDIRNTLKAKSPQVPASLCDKGHLVPNDMLLRLSDIPGCEDDVKICPICYDQNLARASKVPE